MDIIYKFMLVVILSFVGTIILYELVSNVVIFSFILAMVIGFLAVKDG